MSPAPQTPGGAPPTPPHPLSLGSVRSRREVLAAGLTGAAGIAAGAFLAACGGSVSKAVQAAPAGSDLGAIEHVVFLMQENRSFDHYFGAYPGVRGFDDPRAIKGVFAQAWPGAPAAAAGKLLPFHLDTATQDAECTTDLSHAWGAQHDSWDKGKMDAFVKTHVAASVDGPTAGILTMGYYERQDLPFHWALADAFTICDGYHCSVLGPTHPNRLYALSATLDPAGHAGGPVLITNQDNGAKFSVSWETMPERLEDKGVSWKVYNPPNPAYGPASTHSMLLSNNILLYFRQYSSPSSPLYKKAFTPTFPNDFAADVKSDSLPQVSWLIPPIGYDEHPPAPPARGAWFIDQALSALVANPKVWAKTALFVMYDENDGLFDHVPPPSAPAGTAGEYVSASPLPADASGIAGPIGLGFRVPMLVVSPFSRGGWVCSDTFDHTSQLRFLETRFGVDVPNLSAWRRGVTGDLTTTLHLGSADTSTPSLPGTSQNPPVLARECKPLQLSELNVAMPQYPVPLPQTMPRQAAGSRRHTPR